MICPDINVLLYAMNEAFTQHDAAKAWWDGLLSGTERVGIPHVVLLGFIRIATSPRIFEAPFTVQECTSIVDGWLDQPNVQLIAPGPGYWSRLKELLEQAGPAGNLTTDAHIAAVASEHGMVVFSNDTDFARFVDIRVVNPLL